MFIRNIQRIYSAPLLQRSFSTNQPLAEYNKVLEKFKLKQAKMQCDDDLPVYLKGGTRDKILFNITVAMIVYGTLQSAWIVRTLLKKYN